MVDYNNGNSSDFQKEMGTLVGIIQKVLSICRQFSWSWPLGTPKDVWKELAPTPYGTSKSMALHPPGLWLIVSVQRLSIFSGENNIISEWKILQNSKTIEIYFISTTNSCITTVAGKKKSLQRRHYSPESYQNNQSTYKMYYIEWVKTSR